MEKFKVTENRFREKQTFTYVYYAKSPRDAIKKVANRFGNPHYTKPEFVFNRFGDSASTNQAWYDAEQIFE